MQRQFTSGSRQAPDPYDQYLEKNNFYRKHTARDPSCLFRVISEQVYDTQLHHMVIRKKCVKYMRKYQKYFQTLIDRDINEYLDDLSKPKTYGTFIELRAVAYMFQRNVVLFEPFDLGTYFTCFPYFTKIFRVFFTPERHFDSVFTCDYIKDAAMCQAICYQILYKDLYKLPDVEFAVEVMLHSHQSAPIFYKANEDGYSSVVEFSDGRVFDLNLPEDTNCILENEKLCHFHYKNFEDDLQLVHRDGDSGFSRTIDSVLPNKYTSCVRQLLHEGITPFPYKVAKALECNMYRNIEFDAWNEARKELRYQNWYNGDGNFKVGAKCHVKLSKTDADVHVCYIQEIAMDKGYCVVYVEQMGERRVVPYDSLMPLPPDQFKPWALPYRFQKHVHNKCGNCRVTYPCSCRRKFGDKFSPSEYCNFYCTIRNVDEYKHQYGYPASAVFPSQPDCYYRLKPYTQLDNFEPRPSEYCALPLSIEGTPNEGDSENTEQQDKDNSPQDNPQNSLVVHEDAIVSTSAENSEPSANTEYYYPPPGYVGPNGEYYPYNNENGVMSNHGGTVYFMCNNEPALLVPPHNNSYYQGYQPVHNRPLLSTAAVHAAESGYNSHFPSSPFNARVLTTPINIVNVNLDARKSTKMSGSDLPSDMATLRHFYNLGIDCHFNHCSRTIDDKEDDRESRSGERPKSRDTDNNHFGTKFDSNNNTMPNKNGQFKSICAPSGPPPFQHPPSKYGGPPNRRGGRYGGNRERGSYSRGGGASTMATSGMHQSRNDSENTLNKNIKPVTNNHSQATSSGPRKITQNANATPVMCPPITHFGVEQNLHTSPNYEHTSGGEIYQPQAAYPPNQAPVAGYNAYEYNANANGQNPMQLAPSGGLYVPMQLTPMPHQQSNQQYAVYAGQQPAAGVYPQYVAPQHLHPMVSNMAVHPGTGTNLASVMAPPATNTVYLAPAGSDIDPNACAGGDASTNNMQYQYMGYSPAMPLYYAPQAGNGGVQPMMHLLPQTGHPQSMMQNVTTPAAQQMFWQSPTNGDNTARRDKANSNTGNNETK